MSRVLVAVATEMEISALRPRLRAGVDVLVTGAGMVATAAQCATTLARTPFDFALNVGLCGSFDVALPPSTVVHVTRDQLSELGAEDGDSFIPIDALPFPSESVFVGRPPDNAALKALPSVNGITVNTVHGNDASIAAVTARCLPQVESMEGAAFMCACTISGVPFAQVRAVSNRVERRSRGAWRIDDALAALHAAVIRILDCS